MDIRDLKTGLFGYNRHGVYEYLAELDKGFNERFAEQKKDTEKLLAARDEKNSELLERIAQLESDNEALRKELESRNEEAESAKAELSELRELLNAQNVKLAQNEADLEALKAEAAGLQRRIDEEANAWKEIDLSGLKAEKEESAENSEADCDEINRAGAHEKEENSRKGGLIEKIRKLF